MVTKEMVAHDLEHWSLADLEYLQREIGRAINNLRLRRRQGALAAVEAAAREHGFSLNELFGTSKRSSVLQAKVKYRHPENAEITWSGRGRPPGWIKSGLAKGASLDDYLDHRVGGGSSPAAAVL